MNKLAARNPLFELLIAHPDRALMADARSGSTINGRQLAHITGRIASKVECHAPVAVLCGDRFSHAVITTGALAAGATVLPLEPETPGWILKGILRAAGGVGVPTVITDEHTQGSPRLLYGTRVLDGDDFCRGSVDDEIGAEPPPGAIMTVSCGLDGAYQPQVVRLGALWGAALTMGARLGLSDGWRTASVTSLGTPGAWLCDVLAALAAGSLILVMPLLRVSDPASSLEPMLEREVNSFTAPPHLLRHLLASVSAARHGSLRYAVSTGGSLGTRLCRDYARATGHDLIAGQASVHFPLWGALGSIEHPHQLRTGLGLVPRPVEFAPTSSVTPVPLGWELEEPGADPRRKMPAELRGVWREDGELEVESGAPRLYTCRHGVDYHLASLDLALIEQPQVVDSYTVRLPDSAGAEPGLASLVVLTAQVSNHQLRQAIARLTPDPQHGFVRVAEVPRLLDGSVLEEDARALAAAACEE